MAKYDWEKLKRKFVTTSSKCTLKQFAIDNNLPYGLLRQKAKGWNESKRTNEEQKTNRIITKTIEKEIDREVDCNTRHYEIYEKLLESIDNFLGKDKLLMPKVIKELADAMKTIQQGQRLASGLDKENKGGSENVIKDFMEAVISKGNDTKTSG